MSITIECKGTLLEHCYTSFLFDSDVVGQD